jgi:hypothetical protein
MRAHVLSALNKLYCGCDRAHTLRLIHEHLIKFAPPALDCSDILRASLVMAVSSFDLYMHDIFREEVIHRLKEKRNVFYLRIPFELLIANNDDQIVNIDNTIRTENSFKSFVAPDKLAECLRAFMECPWDQIAIFHGEPAAICKAQLKSIVDLRNRIAHEADINPTYAGIDLWPIYVADVERSVDFLRSLATAIAKAIDNS